MSIESLTAALAIWGAVVGTISLGWHIYRGVTDRGSLRIRCRIARFAVVPIAVPGEVRPTEPMLDYTITNVGRRPIFVSQFGGGYEDGKGFEVVPRTTPWPKELKPGESISERAEDPVKVLLGNGGAKFVGVRDATGRLYAIPRGDLRRLKGEAERLRDSGGSPGGSPREEA